MPADGTVRKPAVVAEAATNGGQPTPRPVVSAEAAAAIEELVAGDNGPVRETFIPVTRHALIDRLTRPAAWAPGEASKARRFYRYLSQWRTQQYGAEVLALEQTYEPFNPDSDLLLTRRYTDGERAVMQKRFVSRVEYLLRQANYVKIDAKKVDMILTKESHYGLDFHVDLEAFDELLIYYRGASSRTDHKRTFRKFFRRVEYEVPIFQRLFLLFKLKEDEARVEEIRVQRRITRKEARRVVRKLRQGIPAQVRSGDIFIKLFKDMPRADIEMVFPNTKVKFRLFDKVKLGLTSGAGLGVGVATAAGKVALAASNPIAAAGAVAGLGGLAFRQVMGFLNQRQRYMVVMAQNLYFHALADNKSALIKLADRAAEEDVKEEMLLYAVLAKESVNRRDLDDVDLAIEQHLRSAFDIDVDFDLEDALSRLIADGIVSERSDGALIALPPEKAAQRIDDLWDGFLDNLPDGLDNEGLEFEGNAAGMARTQTMMRPPKDDSAFDM